MFSWINKVFTGKTKQVTPPLIDFNQFCHVGSQAFLNYYRNEDMTEAGTKGWAYVVSTLEYVRDSSNQRRDFSDSALSEWFDDIDPNANLSDISVDEDYQVENKNGKKTGDKILQRAFTVITKSTGLSREEVGRLSIQDAVLLSSCLKQSNADFFDSLIKPLSWEQSDKAQQITQEFNTGNIQEQYYRYLTETFIRPKLYPPAPGVIVTQVTSNDASVTVNGYNSLGLPFNINMQIKPPNKKEDIETKVTPLIDQYTKELSACKTQNELRITIGEINRDLSKQVPNINIQIGFEMNNQLYSCSLGQNPGVTLLQTPPEKKERMRRIAQVEKKEEFCAANLPLILDLDRMNKKAVQNCQNNNKSENTINVLNQSLFVALNNKKIQFNEGSLVAFEKSIGNNKALAANSEYSIDARAHEELLKCGLTKEEIEALPVKEMVRLASVVFVAVKDFSHELSVHRDIEFKNLDDQADGPLIKSKYDALLEAHYKYIGENFIRPQLGPELTHNSNLTSTAAIFKSCQVVSLQSRHTTAHEYHEKDLLEQGSKVLIAQMKNYIAHYSNQEGLKKYLSKSHTRSGRAEYLQGYMQNWHDKYIEASPSEKKIIRQQMITELYSHYKSMQDHSGEISKAIKQTLQTLLDLGPKDDIAKKIHEEGIHIDQARLAVLTNLAKKEYGHKEVVNQAHFQPQTIVQEKPKIPVLEEAARPRVGSRG